MDIGKFDSWKFNGVAVPSVHRVHKKRQKKMNENQSKAKDEFFSSLFVRSVDWILFIWLPIFLYNLPIFFSFRSAPRDFIAVLVLLLHMWVQSRNTLDRREGESTKSVISTFIEHMYWIENFFRLHQNHSIFISFLCCRCQFSSLSSSFMRNS